MSVGPINTFKWASIATLVVGALLLGAGTFANFNEFPKFLAGPMWGAGGGLVFVVGIVQLVALYIRYKGREALAEAITQNNKERVLQLLPSVDINATNSLGRTPLTHAVAENKPEMVELLIQRGADIRLADECGWTPITRAVTTNIELLNKFPKEETKLWLRAHYSIPEDVNAVDANDQTPLVSATIEGNLDKVRVLIYLGADVNKAENFCYTPLLYAALNQPKIFDYLSKKGADPNKIDKGLPPLALGIITGNAQLIKKVKEIGGDEEMTQEWLRRKVLAHVWGMSGKSKIGESHFELSVFTQLAGKYISLQFLREFLLNKEHREEILEVVENSFLSPEKILKRAQPTFIVGGPKRHFIYFLITKDRVYQCDRRRDRKEHKIVTYRIDKPLTKDQIYVMQKIPFDEKEFQKLPLTHLPEESVNLKNQENDMCSWVSAKTGLLALFIHYYGKEEGYKLYKEFTAYSRIKGYKDYKANSKNPDKALIDRIEAKLKAKVEKNKPHYHLEQQ